LSVMLVPENAKLRAVSELTGGHDGSDVC